MKNKAGFLIAAIQEDWKDARVDEKKRWAEVRRTEREQHERQAHLRAIKQDFERYRKTQALEQYEQFRESTRRLQEKVLAPSLESYLQQVGIALTPEDLETLSRL